MITTPPKTPTKNQIVVKVQGTVLESNIDEHEDAILQQLKTIDANLTTDDHFYQAAEMVKRLKSLEVNLKEAKLNALGQMEQVNNVFSRIDNISETARQKRLQLDRIVKQRKEEVKDELLDEYEDHFFNFYKQNCQKLKVSYENLDCNPKETLKGAIKGKGSINSIRTALSQAVDKLIEIYKSHLDNLPVIQDMISKSKYPYLFSDPKICLMRVGELRRVILERVEVEEARLEREKQEKESAETERLEQKKNASETARQFAATTTTAPPPIEPPTTPPDPVPASANQSSEINQWYNFYQNLSQLITQVPPNTPLTEKVKIYLDGVKKKIVKVVDKEYKS